MDPFIRSRLFKKETRACLLGATLIACLFLQGRSSAAGDALDQWHIRTPPGAPSKENFEGVAYGNGRWVVVGNKGSILSSANGVDWDLENNPGGTTSIEDVTFAQGMFVGVGSGNELVLTSSDGRNWTKQPLRIGGGREIIHDGTRFVVLDAGGFLSTSVDGVAWEFPKRVPTLYVDVGGIAFANNTYVVVGYSRTGKPTDLWSAPGLEDWQFREAKVQQHLFGVTYGLGLFVAVGYKGSLITSPDGVEWTQRTVPHTGFIWDVCAGGPYLAAAGQWGRILTSSNGVDWTRHETGLDWHLTDIAFGNETFVAVGWDGQIVQSDPITAAGGDGTIILSQPNVTGAGVQLKFTGTIGAFYQVQATEDWLSWTPVTNVQCTSSPMVVSLSAPKTAARFYRVAKP